MATQSFKRNPADVRAGVDASKTTYDPKTGRESSKQIKGVQKEVGYSKSGGRTRQVVSKTTTLEAQKAKSQDINKQISQQRQVQLERAKQAERTKQATGTYQAAPKVEGGIKELYVPELSKKAQELSYKAKSYKEKSPLKGQAYSFGAVGLSAAATVGGYVRRPWRVVTDPIKMGKQLITDPKGSLKGMFEKARTEPEVFTGEIIGTAGVYKGFGVGATKLGKSSLKSFERVEIEGVVTQKGKVTEIGNVQKADVLGEFKGTGRKYYQVGKKQFGETKFKDVKAEVQYKGTKSAFDVGVQSQLKVKGKPYRYVGKGEGVSSGARGAEIYELVGGKVKGTTKTYQRGVRGYEVKLGKQDIVKVTKLEPFPKETLSTVAEARIEGVSKATMQKTFKTSKGTTYPRVIGSTEEIFLSEFTKPGKITTISDAGTFGIKKTTPITKKVTAKEILYTEVPQKKLSVPKKVSFEAEVPIPKSSLETFQRVGIGYSKTYPKKITSETALYQNILKKAVPKKYKLPSGQLLGVDLVAPTTEVTIAPKLKPSFSYTKQTGLAAKQYALESIKITETNKIKSPVLFATKSYNKTLLPTPEVISEPVIKTKPKVEVKPVVKPDIKPVLKPSLKPALKPVVKPDIKPSLKPSLKPVMKPVLKPVLKPSLKPALKPSLRSSLKPSLKPSIVPTLKSMPFNNLLFPSLERRRRVSRPSFPSPAQKSKPSYTYTLWGLQLPKIKAKKKLARQSYSGVGPRPAVIFPKIMRF